MAGKALKGCFAVAALGGLIIVIVVAIVFWRVKDTALEIKGLKDSHDELVERYGEVDDFLPAADGLPGVGRMERFLALRESLADERRITEARFSEFPPQAVLREEKDGFGAVMEVFRGLGGLIDPVLSYMHARNEALLTEGMGLGEYFYLYSLSYFSLLGHSPGDGPEYTEDGRRERLLDGEDSSFGEAGTMDRYHRYMEQIMARQLAAELARPLDSNDDDALRWRENLRAEYLRFKEDAEAIPWEHGLPAVLQAALGPYRERLVRSYSPTLNCFELAPMKDEEWTIEDD